MAPEQIREQMKVKRASIDSKLGLLDAYGRAVFARQKPKLIGGALVAAVGAALAWRRASVFRPSSQSRSNEVESSKRVHAAVVSPPSSVSTSPVM